METVDQTLAAHRRMPLWPVFACAHILLGLGVCVGVVIFVRNTSELVRLVQNTNRQACDWEGLN